MSTQSRCKRGLIEEVYTWLVLFCYQMVRAQKTFAPEKQVMTYSTSLIVGASDAGSCSPENAKPPMNAARPAVCVTCDRISAGANLHSETRRSWMRCGIHYTGTAHAHF